MFLKAFITIIPTKGSRSLLWLLLGLIVFGGSARPALAVTSTFTASGSWTAPEGVTLVKAEVWGGGGGGGGGTGGGQGGSGGGGGGYARRNSLPVVPGNSYNVTVGLGGTGMSSAPGTSGGQSFFIDGPTLAAMGGGGGGTNGTGPGTGGTGGPGDITYMGGSGAIGATAYGGGAGSSAGNYSPGSPGSGIIGGTPPINAGAGGNGSGTASGDNGGTPGGGGGGAYKTAGFQGGMGRDGQVVITPFYPVPENLMPNNVQQYGMDLTWTSTGNLRGYLVEASTAQDLTGELLGGQTGGTAFNLSGLTPNTTYYIRVGSLWAITTYYASVLPVLTHIEPPGEIFIDEVSSWSITASVYGSTFTNLGLGLSGADLALDNAYTNAWTTNSGSWAELSPIPWVRRAQAAAAALNGQLYLIGGLSAGSPVNANQSNYQYTPQPPGWTFRGDLNVYRYGLSAAVVGGKIYAVGGLDVGSALQTVNEAYDPATNSWSVMAPMPTPRAAFGLAALRGKLYAVGGDDGAVYNKTEVYDPASNSWKTETALLTPRWGLALAAVNGRLYALGGYKNLVGYSDDNEEYDPDSKVWTPRARLPAARRNLSGAVAGGKVYAIGGHDGVNPQARADVYEPGSNTWASAAPLPAARENAAAVTLGGKIYLLGGFNIVELASATVYNPGVTKVFTGLQPNRQYSLKGKVRNQNGMESAERGGPQTYTLAYSTVPEGGASPFSYVGDGSLTVRWSSGSVAGGYSGNGAKFEVQAATSADFRGDVRWNSIWEDYYSFNDLQPKTTYFVRVLAKNGVMESDYAWTLLGSTLTLRRPLGGAIISSVTWSAANYNWGRTVVRDSQGALYAAYLKMYFGKARVFVSKSLDNGLTWADTTQTPVETLGDEGAPNSYDQYSPALAVDSKDGLHLVWGGLNNSLDGSGGDEPKCVYSSSTLTGWTLPVKIPAASFEGIEGTFSVALDSNDGVHVLWSGEDSPGGPGSSSIRYSSRTATDVVWTPYVSVNDDGKQADYPALAIDDHDGLHVVARHAHNALSNVTEDIVYSSRTLSTGWGPWTVITDGGIFHQGEPTLTIDSGKNLFAAWYAADASNSGNSRIKYAVRPHGGNWTAANYLQAEPTQPQKYPSAAADALGNVYVLWSGSDTLNSAVNLKGSVYTHSMGAWDTIDELTDEPDGEQRYPQLRWSGWHNNAGGIDVLWTGYDGVSASTAVLRHMPGADVYMSPGWSAVEWPLPAQCAYALNVRQDGTGDFIGIQQALSAMPTDVSTAACVVVRDTQTYNEQISVEGFRIRGWDSPTARLILMSDPTFLSSAPVINPPATFPAFRLVVDSVTVQGFTITPQVYVPYGVLSSSSSALISRVNVLDPASRIMTAGISLSSRSVVEYSTISVPGAQYGVKMDGGWSRLTLSSVTADFLSAVGVYSASSSNTISGSCIHADSGQGILVDWSGDSTRVEYSTVTTNWNGAFSAALKNQGHFTAVDNSYLAAPNTYGALFYGYGNSVYKSTIAGGGGLGGLYLGGSSTNTISQSLLHAPGTGGGYGLKVMGAGNYNTVTQSRIQAAGAGLAAVKLDTSHNISFTASDLYSDEGDGLEATNISSLTVSYSTITTGAAGFTALRLFESSLNKVDHSLLSAAAGDVGVRLDTRSDNNSFTRSTMTGGAYAGMIVNYSSTNTIYDCYLQGPAAGLEVRGSTVTLLRGSVLAALNPSGIAFWATGGSSGVLLATTTLVTGADGYGVRYDAYNGGKLEVASTTFAGGKFGIYLSTPGAEGRINFSSVTFRSLTPGATAIEFGGGYYSMGNSEFNEVYFDLGGTDVNVNASRLEPGSYLFVSHPEGKWGALHENDPYSFVNWPTTRALPLWPANGATGVSMAPALRAMPEWGSSVAQYAYKVGYDQYIAAPIWGMDGFDQTAAQSFLSYGAFSGQDATLAAAGDSFLYNSTATFVFYSTATSLISNTTYYWSVRVRTPESGAYGQWSATQSFTTGELASGMPVNNLAVTQVTLSSPTVDGVNIGFRIKENNLFQGSTAGGAIYNTADWVFVKFSTQAGADGTWNHATLTGGQVGAGATLAAVSDKKGVFLNHTNTAAYWTAAATVTWKYADDGVTGGNAVVKVFAVSMVRVPMGGFQYNVDNLGGTGVNNIAGPATVGAGDLPSGASAGWPNGYNPFYLMRYEITQGQYADFLNNIPSADATVLYSNNNDSGHYMTNSGMYEAADRFAAKNYLSTTDTWSFLSWAGLRPPTEMEFEKAARDLNADARVYPWGGDAPDAALYAPPNEGGTHFKHYMNYYTPDPPRKVLDSGRYMSGDAYRTPAQTGASPYGLADLAGNVFEYVINCSHLVVPGEGNGTLIWPSSWPAADAAGKGLRGGSFGDYSQYAKVSDRTIISAPTDSRDSRYGGRGARTAP
ncbi:MAG: hypothetical protein A2X32_02170 [Elusimicrobia bacterium GWC2_64_44]|nr:MAG: hypothetical protein A2X32_02170 [Elusimicrobia bacterium GWC2_64_44]